MRHRHFDNNMQQVLDLPGIDLKDRLWRQLHFSKHPVQAAVRLQPNQQNVLHNSQRNIYKFQAALGKLLSNPHFLPKGVLHSRLQPNGIAVSQPEVLLWNSAQWSKLRGLHLWLHGSDLQMDQMPNIADWLFELKQQCWHIFSRKQESQEREEVPQSTWLYDWQPHRDFEVLHLKWLWNLDFQNSKELNNRGSKLAVGRLRDSTEPSHQTTNSRAVCDNSIKAVQAKRRHLDKAAPNVDLHLHWSSHHLLHLSWKDWRGQLVLREVLD